MKPAPSTYHGGNLTIRHRFGNYILKILQNLFTNPERQRGDDRALRVDSMFFASALSSPRWRSGLVLFCKISFQPRCLARKIK